MGFAIGVQHHLLPLNECSVKPEGANRLNFYLQKEVAEQRKIFCKRLMAKQLLSYHNWWSCFLKGLVHLPNLFFSSTLFLSSAARCFWTCTIYKKKIQEGGEERKDHSEGIWLGLIWKYCFTSSEPNYWSELVVLRKPAHSHRSPDGQGVVRRSVTVTTVCTWTPGYSTALLSCSRSEALLCYLWTSFQTQRQCLKRSQTFFFTLSSSAAFVLHVCMS